MKAALVKSAKDAQIRDSFNKESFAIITNDSIFQFLQELNRLEHVLPRNATKLHTVLVRPTDFSVAPFILNFEVLESAITSWDGSSRHLDESLKSIVIKTTDDESTKKSTKVEAKEEEDND